jgi:hypothetical protein
MVAELKALATDDSMQRAVDLTPGDTRKNFPVVSNGTLKGIGHGSEYACNR